MAVSGKRSQLIVLLVGTSCFVVAHGLRWFCLILCAWVARII